MKRHDSKTRVRTAGHTRTRKRFLQLATIAFALGSQTLPARADEAAPTSQRTSPALDATDDGHVRHRIVLAAGPGAEREAARVEVIALGLADAFALEAAGDCCIGPLRPGPHVVRVTQGQKVDTQLLRIDGNSGHYLIVSG